MKRDTQAMMAVLCRIERRCRRIERTLAAMGMRNDPVDDAIERLHQAAVALRGQSRREKELCRRKYL